MLRKRTTTQWVQIFQITILIVFFVLTVTKHLGAWVIIFPILILTAQIFLWFYQWKKGNRQPLKDAGFRYMVMIVTLLVLLFFFGKG